MLLLASRCSGPVSTGEVEISEKDNSSLTVSFYNVENLFDTENDPNTQDEDFTPEGKLAWTKDRLEFKIERIVSVLKMIDSDFPDLAGLCEVENRSVLEMLVNSPALKSAGYEIIHQESPDERGIDVALLYKPASLKLISSEFLKVVLSDGSDPNTRDILHAEFKDGSEALHIYVNHWPSRSKGQAESEVHRITAAGVAKSNFDQVVAKNPEAKVLFMGDFNDYPTDRSIKGILGAGNDRSSQLYNYMYALNESGDGSYWYQGDWGTLDQFIGTWNLVESGNGWHATEANILKSDTLFFTDGKGIKRPNRTYAGDSYKAGFSDHLPIYIKLKKD